MHNHISSLFLETIILSQTTKDEKCYGNHDSSIIFNNEDYNWTTTSRYESFIGDDVDFVSRALIKVDKDNKRKCRYLCLCENDFGIGTLQELSVTLCRLTIYVSLLF